MCLCAGQSPPGIGLRLSETAPTAPFRKSVRRIRIYEAPDERHTPSRSRHAALRCLGGWPLDDCPLGDDLHLYGGARLVGG